ncbi:MAG: adenylate/guanylate cyclase domain-containing protein, partial [Actinobacteria bacterium]|nr:adenylate/guanylate cyclase domain-containing protein [Actinomycetota bacterium]
RRLAEEVRLIVFNPRGTGLSDRPRNVTLEARMDDINAVLDAIGGERATLFGVAESANVCALFAATYPERCERLALWAPYARALRTDTYPFGGTEEGWLASVRDVRERWGDRELLAEWAQFLDPAVAEDDELFEAFVWMQRLAVSPSAAADFLRMQMDTDVTGVLGSIRIPTLVLYRGRDRDEARYVAERIPGAETVEFGGDSAGPYSDDVADALLAFVRAERIRAVPDSVLATVLFTDLVGSTERAAALGDRAWREVLANHHRLVRQELGRYRGVEIDTAGDGFFCRFDGPARAIACARRIVEGAVELDLQVRAGIHTGECELVGDKVAGIAVVTGARVSSKASPGEVLVSSTVKDLVAGSGFSFVERGEHELKGVPGTWRLYAVTDG